MMTLTRTVMAVAALLAVAVTARADVTLNSARIGAEDVAAVEKFYQDAFGLKEVNRLEFPGAVEVMLNFGATMEAAKANGAAQIVIMTRDSDDVSDAIPHIIFDVTDMAATVKAIEAAGGKMDGEPQPFGNTGIVIGFTKDPAGNRIELIQPADR
jgi:predicted enzyme related to lactoylglutathione lyase